MHDSSNTKEIVKKAGIPKSASRRPLTASMKSTKPIMKSKKLKAEPVAADSIESAAARKEISLKNLISLQLISCKISYDMVEQLGEWKRLKELLIVGTIASGSLKYFNLDGISVQSVTSLTCDKKFLKLFALKAGDNYWENVLKLLPNCKDITQFKRKTANSLPVNIPRLSSIGPLIKQKKCQVEKFTEILNLDDSKFVTHNYCIVAYSGQDNWTVKSLIEHRYDGITHLRDIIRK